MHNKRITTTRFRNNLSIITIIYLSLSLIGCGKTVETENIENYTETQVVDFDETNNYTPITTPLQDNNITDTNSDTNIDIDTNSGIDYSEPEEEIFYEDSEVYAFPTPIPEVVNSDPREMKYQLYDVMFIYPRWFYMGNSKHNGYINYYGSMKNYYLSGSLSESIASVAQTISTIENSTTLEIIWQDYNPDRLIAPNQELFIQGTDIDGTLVYNLWTYNNTDSTQPLSECVATETIHYGNYYADSVPKYWEDAKYITVFGNINIYSGEWTYSKVKEVVESYSPINIKEYNSGNSLVMNVQYDIDYQAYDMNFAEDATENCPGGMYADFRDSKASYTFSFNIDSGMLEYILLRYK